MSLSTPRKSPYPHGVSFRLMIRECVVTSGNWSCRGVCGLPRSTPHKVTERTSFRNAYQFSRAMRTVASTSILFPLKDFVSDAMMRAYFISSGKPDFLEGL